MSGKRGEAAMSEFPASWKATTDDELANREAAIRVAMEQDEESERLRLMAELAELWPKTAEGVLAKLEEEPSLGEMSELDVSADVREAVDSLFE